MFESTRLARSWRAAVALFACVGANLTANADAARWSFYVTNESSGDLSIIDGHTLQVTATIPLGKRPRGIQPAPDQRHLYIAFSGSPAAPPGTDESKLPPPDRTADGIGVFDTKTRSVERVLRGVTDPEQLAVSADGRRIYVASEDAGRAIVLDTKNGRRLAEVDVGGEPEGTTLSPDGRYIYMTSEADHVVSVIETSSDRVVGKIQVGLRPRSIAFSHDGRRAYVSGEGDGTITVIDTAARARLQTFHFENKSARPMGLVVARDDQHLFVTTGRGGTLARIDLQPMQLSGELAVGARPWGIAMSPDGAILAAANGPSNDVTLIDAKQFAVIKKVAVGKGPWGVAVQRNLN